MKDFDAIKELWQQSKPAAGVELDLHALQSQHAGIKRKLIRQQSIGSITLVITGVIIIWVSFFSGIRFQQVLTYFAVSLMVFVVWMQALIMFFVRRRLMAINDTLPPAQHLGQWNDYYAFRQKQINWNKPLYFLVLNLAMGLYFIEIFSGRPVLNVIIFIAVYIGWMLFAYLVLGKRSLKKEEDRLKTIIGDLKKLIAQLK